MVDQNALIDLGFVGHAFTWTNRKVEKSNIQEWLDRCFVNNEWRLLYPNMVISHLPALPSDHRPILINLTPPSSNRPRPFRFEAIWTRDKSTAIVIEKA